VWDLETLQDHKINNTDPMYQINKVYAQATALLNATSVSQPLIASIIEGKDSLDTSGAKDLIDACSAIRKLAGEKANADSVYYKELAYGTKESKSSATSASNDALSRLLEACESVYVWGQKQRWFDNSTFVEVLSPPVLALKVLPRLDVYPDPLFKLGCIIGVDLDSKGQLIRGDKIVGIGKSASGEFTPVNTWRDLRLVLISYTEKPTQIFVQVKREGETRVESAGVCWR
jgi:hypothetical protein